MRALVQDSWNLVASREMTFSVERPGFARVVILVFRIAGVRFIERCVHQENEES